MNLLKISDDIRINMDQITSIYQTKGISEVKIFLSSGQQYLIGSNNKYYTEALLALSLADKKKDPSPMSAMPAEEEGESRDRRMIKEARHQFKAALNCNSHADRTWRIASGLAFLCEALLCQED